MSNGRADDMKEKTKDSFSIWLLTKLNEMKVDENIFLEYIRSILEGEETRDEKLETLESVLMDSFSSQSQVSQHCTEILDKWQEQLSAAIQESEEKSAENLDEKLARLMEASVQLEEAAQHSNRYTDEELKIREAILSQYGQADEPDDEEYEEEGSDSRDDLEKNMNAVNIHQAEKEKREKAKLENQKKKERDKMEREKQKLTHQEKKEARRKRAQKVEHHRK